MNAVYQSPTDSIASHHADPLCYQSPKLSKASKPTDDKTSPKGCGEGRYPILHFGAPIISLELLKLESSAVLHR